MEDDLWGGPPTDSVVQDDFCYMQTGCGFGFYFDCRLDVIEENALNERSCIQVLSILIKKAVTEKNGLERDLLLRENELAWTSYEDWPDMCFNGLREKIDGVDKSPETLRKGNLEDSEIQLLIGRGPTERLQEILRALLKNHCRAEDKLEQNHDVIVSDSHLDSAECATENLDKIVKTCNFNDTENIEITDPRYATTDQGPGLKVQEKITTDPETPEGLAKSSSPDASEDSIDSKNERNFADVVVERDEGGCCDSLSSANNTVLDPPKQADVNEHFKIQQPRKTFAEGSTIDVNAHAIAHLNEIHKSAKSSASFDKNKSTAAARQEKHGSPDMKQKLAKAKQILKGKSTAPAEKMDSPQIVSFEDFQTAKECSAVDSLSDICGVPERGKEKTENTEDERSQTEAVHMDESTVAYGELVLDLFTEPTIKKAESDAESNTENIKKPESVSMEKRQQKSRNKNAGLNESFNGNIKRKITPKRLELSSAVDDCQKPIKKRKKVLTLPMVKENNCSIAPMQSSDKQGDSADNLSKNEVRIVPGSMIMTSDLKDMKLKDLKAIARRQKVTQYYKLKKDDLVERLTNQLGPS